MRVLRQASSYWRPPGRMRAMSVGASSAAPAAPTGAGGSRSRTASSTLFALTASPELTLCSPSHGRVHSLKNPAIVKDFYMHPETRDVRSPILVYPEDARADRRAAKDVKNGRAFFSPSLFNDLSAATSES